MIYINQKTLAMKKFWKFIYRVIRDNELHLPLFIAVLAILLGCLVSFLFYKDHFIGAVISGGIGCGILFFLMYFLPKSTDEVVLRETMRMNEKIMLG
jgi:hypothetical protein